MFLKYLETVFLVVVERQRNGLSPLQQCLAPDSGNIGAKDELIVWMIKGVPMENLIFLRLVFMKDFLAV